MALDIKTPKGYRKAWNGGTPPKPTIGEKAFHAHLDMCRQCHDHPFELCTLGSLLLAIAVKA